LVAQKSGFGWINHVLQRVEKSVTEKIYKCNNGADPARGRDHFD